MIYLLATIAVLACYLAIGWRLARRGMPRAWAIARRDWIFDSSILSSVKEQTVVTVLFWPIALPIRAVNDAMHKAIPLYDPKERERRIREQQEYIRRLERENGIGGDR